MYLLSAALMWGGCGGAAVGEPPVPGQPRGRIPDLGGSTVLVYPMQRRGAVPGDVDAEIGFALEGSGSRARWIGPDALREHLARSPSLPLQVDALPVDIFLAGEVIRVGDPLFGFIRRMAVLENADFALIPVAIGYRAATEERGAALELVATLLDAQSGRVLWQATLEGEGAVDDPATLARVAQELAAWFR